MRTVHVQGVPALTAAIKADMKRLGLQAKAATRRTADVGRLIVFGNAPVAFGDLRGSIVDQGTATGARIRAQAPHAAALEVGSKPHFPPLEPLIAWVKLRGMQGLNAGTSAKGHPGRVAAEIRRRGSSKSTPVNAPRQIAYQIARAISLRGTKPHWFMRSSLPELRALLHGYMEQHLKRG